MAHMAGGGPVKHLTSLWAATEALAKALGDALSHEPSRLGSPHHWPRGEAGPWRAQPLPAPRGHVAWLCWWSSNWRSASAGRAAAGRAAAERAVPGEQVPGEQVPGGPSLRGRSDSFVPMPGAGD